ncbi:MAG TPA: 4Fe-4S dicluster domain-containing protein, partial [Planctomycetaceae bacterium]|nr:4Fe-4S dicluster domain-containing protein [Planctomycetaceae bacterium]
MNATPSIEPNSLAGAAAPPRPGQGIDYGLFLDCVHCGLCTAACPTFLETGDENDSPRGRIYLMRAVTDGRIELNARVQRHLDLCLDCRGCETACPSGVRYGRLIEPFRLELMAWKAARGQSNLTGLPRWVLFQLFPHARRLRWALGPARIMQTFRLDRLLEQTGLIRSLPPILQRMYRLLPRLSSYAAALPRRLPARGPRRARVALFTGCVADAMFRHVHWATARVLQENGCEVWVPPRQACCGAIHYHNGAGQEALALA